MLNGFANKAPVSLRSYTGPVSTGPFAFSKDSRTTARQAARRDVLRALPFAEFAARTQIEILDGTDVAHAPFVLWPAQAELAQTLERDRLIIILKARQLGISWLVCLYALRLCLLYAGRPVLCLSRGQLEADELVHRISFMYHGHVDRAVARLVTDNTAALEWDNGSSVVSLAATKDAGRSMAAALVILDEWAFMKWPDATLAAVKPTIDAGGQLVILSSADGQGTTYHRHWQAARSGANGYTPVFLPWTARPGRGAAWRDQKLVEASGDTAQVAREYPANDIEAFTHAAGLVYDVWSDGPAGGNVTEGAEYIEGGGPLYWACDDGYAGERDPRSGHFSADSHPRVFLLVQERADGRLCVFAEDYRIKALSDAHISDIAALDYPAPDYVALDSSAAELRGRLQLAGYYTRGKPAKVDESIKATRRMLAADANGWRRILVHPRCTHLRAEMASYRYDPQSGVPITQFDHGPDALRYLAWTKRHEG